MEIDLSTIKNKQELHFHLSQKLSFPSFYGNNWDAFWDLITGLIELPKEINFVGADSFKAKLPTEYQQLKGCFDDLPKEYPDIICKVSWR